MSLGVWLDSFNHILGSFLDLVFLLGVSIYDELRGDFLEFILVLDGCKN